MKTTHNEQYVMDCVRKDGVGRFAPGGSMALTAENLVDDGRLVYVRGTFRLPPGPYSEMKR